MPGKKESRDRQVKSQNPIWPSSRPCTPKACMMQPSARRAASLSAPARRVWTAVRGGSAGGRAAPLRGPAAAAAPPARRWHEAGLGPLAAGGQRRFLSSEEKKQEKKEPKAGVGVFATFMKSIRDQMGARAQSDEELAAAQERLEQARLESIQKAEAAMKRAQEAAEEASPAARYGRACVRMCCPRACMVAVVWACSRASRTCQGLTWRLRAGKEARRGA